MKPLTDLIDAVGDSAECEATDFVAKRNFKGGLGELAGGIGFEAGHCACFDVLAPALKAALHEISDGSPTERKIRKILEGRAT